MSIFLTFMLLRLFAAPQSFSLAEAARGFLFEMAGGAILGICGGWLLAVTLRRLAIEAALANVLSLAAALVVFGLAQWCGASGFLATYLAGVAAGAAVPQTRPLLEPFFEGMGWLAQIVLFLMLGLMVSPHALPPFILPAVLGTAILLFARPVAVFMCLAAFRFTLREMAFASWVGLRGAVPIYVSLIPGLVDPQRDEPLFVTIFIVVITSLIVQGWTVGLAARWLGFRRNEQGVAATIARSGGER